MKKILYSLLALTMVLAFNSCKDDNDSNPVFKQNSTTFVLNLPTYAANNVVDLKNSSTIDFTTNQPDYNGVPYAVVYTAWVSMDGENWTQLSTTYTTTQISIPTKEVNNALLDLAGDEPDFSAPFAVQFKLTANVSGSGSAVLGDAESNVVTLPNVQAYVPDSNAELPDNMYITGDFPAGNGWGTWVQFAPVYDKAGYFYLMVYMQAGAAFKINPDAAWKGNEMGYNNSDKCTWTDNADAGVTSSSDGNFVFTNGGWYNLVVQAVIEKGAVHYYLNIYEPDIYIIGACEGGNWSVMDEWKFTVPADADSDFVSPALAAGGEVRMCFKFGSIDWWRTEFTLVNNSTIYYRNENIANNWNDDKGSEYSIQALAGQKVYINFTTGTGECK